MSGHDDGSEEERRSLLGEFSAAHKKDFEIWKDRDFEESTKAQAQMRSQKLFEENNLKQRLKAEKDAIGHMSKNLPSYSLSYESASYAKDRYEEIMTRYAQSREMLDIKYSDIRDVIREAGETLTDEFAQETIPPVREPEPPTLDLEQLGIDTQIEFNLSADADYYGMSVGYDYDDGANPFTEEFNARCAGDFDCDDYGNGNGNGNGNDGGRSR